MINAVYLPSPDTVSRLAPGPWIVRFWVMFGSALPSVMVPVTLKLMVSPDAAWLMASRSEQVPLPQLPVASLESAVVFTVRVAARACAALRQSTRAGRSRLSAGLCRAIASGNDQWRQRDIESGRTGSYADSENASVAIAAHRTDPGLCTKRGRMNIPVVSRRTYTVAARWKEARGGNGL